MTIAVLSGVWLAGTACAGSPQDDLPSVDAALAAGAAYHIVPFVVSEEVCEGEPARTWIRWVTDLGYKGASPTFDTDNRFELDGAPLVAGAPIGDLGVGTHQIAWQAWFPEGVACTDVADCCGDPASPRFADCVAGWPAEPNYRDICRENVCGFEVTAPFEVVACTP